MLSLSQMAVATNTTTKAIKNIEQILGVSWEKTRDGAWRLALVTEMNSLLGVPLEKATAVVSSMPHSTAVGIVTIPASDDAAVGISVDLLRAHSNFLARFSRALIIELPKQRGRPRESKRSRVAAAKLHGVDVDLLRSNLRIGVAERLRRLDENAAFVREMRSKERPHAHA